MAEYNGGAGNDDLTGGGTDDVIEGQEGNDSLSGRGGDDELFGGLGDDRLSGGGGNDVLDGGGGSDSLEGGGGDDELDGGRGNDTINGGGGDDVIDAGTGADFIATGGGHDILRFSADSGNDVVTDFNPTNDVLDFTDVSDLSQLQFETAGSDTLVRLPGGSTVTVEGISPEELLENDAVACFLRGTLIRTPVGEVPVESLKIGDDVLTYAGEAKPIRWIGRRTFASAFATRSPRVIPVLIHASALCEGVPHRDLRVSPEHGIYVDGVLIPAAHLLNGRTIVQALPTGEIEYFHVELDDHDILVADGAPAETYMKHGDRKMFANWREYEELYGEEASCSWDGDIVRITRTLRGGSQLASILSHLDRRADEISGAQAA